MNPVSITCKNCGNTFNGKYCNACGEKVYAEKDKKVFHLFEEGFHFITHFEGTFFNTLKAIFTSPGKLSEDYCNGVRKKYFKPLSFFLMLVILYLIFPVFEGLNMKLKYHEMHGVYGKYAAAKVAAVMGQEKITHEALELSFHRAGEKTSKFLLFIIIPFVALLSWAMGFKKRKLYFDHFVFTIEMCSFFLLWGFLLLPLLMVIFKLITGSYLFNSEAKTSIAIFTVFIIYTALAVRRFFHFKWWFRLIYTLAFSLSLIIVLEYIYKFILFIIAINLIK
ncbi:MAG: DUF3667 domain-containing protein [Bacteroidota bacterium]